jgi:hypothetical protein
MQWYQLKLLLLSKENMSSFMLEAKNNLAKKLSDLVSELDNCKLRQQQYDENVVKYENHKLNIGKLKKELLCEKDKIKKLKSEIEKEAKYCNVTPNYETSSINRLEKNVKILENSIQEKESEGDEKPEFEIFSTKEREIKEQIIELKKMLEKKENSIKEYLKKKKNIETLLECKDKYIKYAYKYNICEDILKKYGVELNENPTEPSYETIICDCGCGYIVHSSFDTVCGSKVGNYLEPFKMPYEKFYALYGIEDYSEIKGANEEEYDEQLYDIHFLVMECNVHHTLIIMQSYKYLCKCYKFMHENYSEACQYRCYCVFGNNLCSSNYKSRIEYDKEDIENMIQETDYIDNEHPIGYVMYNNY